MKIVEKIIIAFCAIGLVMKIFNIAGGSVLLVLGLTILSIFYLSLTWLLLRDRETRRYYLGISISAGIVLSTACMAILYKLQLWPGAEVMLMGSLVFIVPLLIIALVLYNKHSKTDKVSARAYRKALQRIVPFFIVTAALFFISNRAMIRFQYRDDPEHARLYIRAIEHPGNEQYWRELEDYEINKYFQTDTTKPAP